MNSNYFVVIMAGGIGSRFWPYSRRNYPKQFLDILNTGKTLIQESYARFIQLVPEENIFVVTNEDYVSIVQKQLPNLKPQQILAEPNKRNTAPCAAYACYKIGKLNPDASVLLAPSDHMISNNEKFIDIASKALDFVSKNEKLLTLGIKPTRPDTGYGYIQYVEDSRAFSKKVKTFTEKPSYEIAKSFIESGEFLWNSGIFLWNVKTIKKAFEKYLPDLHDLFSQGEDKYYTEGEAAAIELIYAQANNISIDNGIMEKADNVNVIPAEFGWSDVGTWKSVYELSKKDYLGNAVNGKHVKIYSGNNNMIVTPKDKLVVIDGLEDYCIINTDDVLMIVPKNKEQEVKNITTDLKREKLDKYL